MWKLMIKDYQLYMLRSYTKLLFLIVVAFCLSTAVLMLLWKPDAMEAVISMISRFMPILAGVMLFFFMLDPFSRSFDQKDLLYKTLPNGFVIWKHGCILNILCSTAMYVLLLSFHVVLAKHMHQNRLVLFTLYGIYYASASYMASQVLIRNTQIQMMKYTYLIYIIFALISSICQSALFASLLNHVGIVGIIDAAGVVMACCFILRMCKEKERRWLS